MTDRELMQQALKALKLIDEAMPFPVAKLTIKNLRERLAQTDQEPLEYWNAVEGWVKIDEVREHFDSVGCGTIYKTAGDGRVPLTAAQRQWVGLSHEEVMDSWDEIRDGDWAPDFYAVIEAKLKEKNT